MCGWWHPFWESLSKSHLTYEREREKEVQMTHLRSRCLGVNVGRSRPSSIGKMCGPLLLHPAGCSDESPNPVTGFCADTINFHAHWCHWCMLLLSNKPTFISKDTKPPDWNAIFSLYIDYCVYNALGVCNRCYFTITANWSVAVVWCTAIKNQQCFWLRAHTHTHYVSATQRQLLCVSRLKLCDLLVFTAGEACIWELKVPKTKKCTVYFTGLKQSN